MRQNTGRRRPSSSVSSATSGAVRCACASPWFFAHIPTCGTFPSAIGDFIASALDFESSAWIAAAGPAELEVPVIDWFAEWIGYPSSAGGLLTSGGSAANMTALACARETLIGAMTADAVVYVSDQGHSSVVRAARTLGFRPDQVRVLPVDATYCMRTDALVGAMDADLAAGRVPLFVAAAAGSTNTGAIDPLVDLAAICRDRAVWLHVDAAYGGFAALTERGRALLSGIELADSVTLDPTNGCTSRSNVGVCWSVRGTCRATRSRSCPTTCATPPSTTPPWRSTSLTGDCS